jgi:hypothetical protein
VAAGYLREHFVGVLAPGDDEQLLRILSGVCGADGGSG